MTTSTNNLTIMKYRTPQNYYAYKILDNFDIPDEAKRLGRMIDESQLLESLGCEILWIKNVDKTIQ